MTIQSKLIWSLFLLVLIFNCVDTWQTKLLLDVGATEINPILRWGICQWGFWPAVVGFKSLGIGLLLGCIVINTKEN